MLKQLKPGRYYIIVNLDEPYAQDVYEVLKYGQMKKAEQGEDAWPEGDVDFVTWARRTWEPAPPHDYESAMLAIRMGQYQLPTGDPWERGFHVPPSREHYSLIATLTAERDAAVEREAGLRTALERAQLQCQIRQQLTYADCTMCPQRSIQNGKCYIYDALSAPATGELERLRLIEKTAYHLTHCEGGAGMYLRLFNELQDMTSGSALARLDGGPDGN